MIKGLLLDFYGTVVEDDDAVMAAIAERSGGDVLDAWVREYYAVAEGPVFVPLRESALRSLATVLAAAGVGGDPAGLCEPLFRRWRTPPLLPGSREFLSRVAVPVCLVSDADRADLDAAVARHGLTFAATVASEDVGAYKPDRRMFARALEKLGLRADEVLHVGDSQRNDVDGARAAGLRAVRADGPLVGLFGSGLVPAI